MRILNSAQMREADRRTIEDIGIPSIVLMENAGRQVVAAIEAAFEPALEGRVAVLCGRGNNGGDGFVAARTLAQRGVDVAVFVVGSIEDIAGDARTFLDVLGAIGVTVVEVADEQAWELHFSEISQCRLIVDALLGTGLSRPLGGLLETVVADLNAAGIPVVSIDLPSGLDANTSYVQGACVDAALTVALAAPKVPLVLPPAESFAGDVVVADIGIPAEVIETLDAPDLDLMTPEELRVFVSPRASDSHKGDFGRVLVVGGSRGRTGAAYLAAMGALRSGAGLVTVSTPASCLPTVAALGAEYMTEALADRDGEVDGRALEAVLQNRVDVVACGPGLGRGPGPAAFVRGLLDRAESPLVLDADALSVMADDPGRLTGRDERPVILTPHPGEMARLIGCGVDEVQANRVQIALDFATTHAVYVVLKGYRTLVATPEGHVFVNPTGNAGMATGGTGDVLTGMIAGWLGQLLDPEAACRLGVYLHGLAGDLAAAAAGQSSLIASDLLRHLGDAVAELVSGARESESQAG
ncbi:MAG: NAD(P)H-hydrate dehydratase [Acidimicrobiia bacterium]|nr:NAD(P)H-hydrate dehydratase [Acidimicrobiia bacterium]